MGGSISLNCSVSRQASRKAHKLSFCTSEKPLLYVLAHLPLFTFFSLESPLLESWDSLDLHGENCNWILKSSKANVHFFFFLTKIYAFFDC